MLSNQNLNQSLYKYSSKSLETVNFVSKSVYTLCMISLYNDTGMRKFSIKYIFAQKGMHSCLPSSLQYNYHNFIWEEYLSNVKFIFTT